MATFQWVVFNIENENFGIEIEKVNIIERMTEIYKIPNTPDFVEGLINLRNKVYTVFNLRKRFGMPQRENNDDSKIIMVNTAAGVIGLMVDEVSYILRIEEEKIENAPELSGIINKQFVKSVAKLDDNVVMLLDLDKIISIEAAV